jgi:TolB-like protein/thioredoxin-like negative regulator of GroEL
VHRHMHRALGSVFAYKAELDAWRQRAVTSRPAPAPATGTKSTAWTASIAVLPFANLSAEPESQYFADGLTEETIAALSKVHALRVTSRTSSMALKGTQKNVRTIGHDLDVNYVVEGTVRRADTRLRMTAQLIDARTDTNLWADTFDGIVEDVFAMQERLARNVVDALRLTLSDDERRRLGKQSIGNVHAYDCYLQARYEALRWRQDAIDRAVLLLRNGLAVVGENAQLYAALGHVYLQYREAGIDFSERPLGHAQACADKVMAIDAQSAAGRHLRAWIHYSNGRVQEAVRDLTSASSIEPRNPDALALLSNCYLISGRVSAARPLIDSLVGIDPLTPLSRCMPGYADLLEGRFDSALEPYRQMLEMDPNNPMARLFYVWVLALNGRAREAEEVVNALPAHARDTVPGRLTFFLGHALAGRRADARAAVTPAIDAAANATELFPRFLAEGYALAGDAERAISWLTIAVERGFINYPFVVQHDPLLRNLQHYPQFQALLSTMRERWERFET